MKRICGLFIFCCVSISVNAQVNIDSLWGLWNNTTNADTVRLYAIDELAWDIRYKNADSAILLATFELDYARQKDKKFWQAKACNTLGVSWYIKSNYEKAIEWHHKCFALWQELGKNEGMAASYNNLGNIYSEQADYVKALHAYLKGLALIQPISKRRAANYLNNIGGVYYQVGSFPKALDQFQKALVICEELNDKEGMANAYNNVGVIYSEAGNHDKALEYYQESVDINKELGDKQGLAESYMNLGLIKYLKGDYTQALNYEQKSLSIEKELDNRQGIASIYIHIGEIYSAEGNISLALENFKKGLELSEQLGTKDKVATSVINIGGLYLKQKNYTGTEVLAKKALRLSEELGTLNYERDASKLLYELYKAWGKNTEALSYHERFLALTDSIEITETNKKLDQMEFAKIMLQDSLEQEKQKLEVKMAHEQEVHKKDQQRNMALYVGGAVIVLAIALSRRLRYVRKTRAVIQKEKDRSENLLLNILPAEIAEELKRNGKAEARDFDMISILFTDFKGFTSISEKLSAKELVAEINYCFEAFDRIVGKYKIEKIKTIGDSYMAAGGLPVQTPDSVKNTVLAALEMQAFINAHEMQKVAEGKPAFQMRVGIHTGSVVAGIVGVKKFQYDVWGDTVNTASRIESSGAVGRVNISETTYDLIRDESLFVFESRGKVQAKGKGEIGMYFVQLSEDKYASA